MAKEEAHVACRELEASCKYAEWHMIEHMDENVCRGGMGNVLDKTLTQ